MPTIQCAISAWPFRGREAELALIAQAMDEPKVAGMAVAAAAGWARPGSRWRRWPGRSRALCGQASGRHQRHQLECGGGKRGQEAVEERIPVGCLNAYLGPDGRPRPAGRAVRTAVPCSLLISRDAALRVAPVP